MHAHDMIRSITGIGEGKGPYISIHDGFIGISKWEGFLPNSDRIILGESLRSLRTQFLVAALGTRFFFLGFGFSVFDFSLFSVWIWGGFS